MKIMADRSTIVVGCTLGILFLVVAYWVLHFWFLRQSFADEIETIEPKTSRLLGIVESADRLEIASGLANSSLTMLAYAADQDSATSAATMQQNVREIMTAAGLSVSGSQILPQRSSEGFDRLGLDITAQGNIDALEEALSNLVSVRPLVFVGALKVSPDRARRPLRGRLGRPEEEVEGDPRKLTVRLQLFSLRLQD
ncbi:MAG: hypothetical protein IPG64_14175 [Haliea sp.]|nr:hypothetical protein [Haliea sp.]